MFTGRLDRIGFLLGIVYTFLPMVIAIILYAVINFALSTTDSFESTNVFRSITNVVLFLFGFANLILIIPATIGIYVRRWHDLGLTGWLTLLGFVPYAGVIPFLILLLAPGQAKSNQYGKASSPRGFMAVVFGK